MPHTFHLDSSSFIFLVHLKIYYRFTYVLQSFTETFKRKCYPKFLVHVQFLMMMQEVCKLDILKNLFLKERTVDRWWHCVSQDLVWQLQKKELFQTDIWKISELKAENLQSYKSLPFLFQRYPQRLKVFLAGRIAGLKLPWRKWGVLFSTAAVTKMHMDLKNSCTLCVLLTRKTNVCLSTAFPWSSETCFSLALA